MIRLHAITLLPLSYYLLTQPSVITDHNLVFMLGEAMGLPQAHQSTSSASSSSSSGIGVGIGKGGDGGGGGGGATPATALVALLLILVSVTDLSTFMALSDDVDGGGGSSNNKEGGGGEGARMLHFYWRSIVPLRLLFFFVVTGGSYLGAEGAVGMLKGKGRRANSYTAGASALRGSDGMSHGWRGACCNSLVFTWGFLEMVFWFWMFVTLREEGKMRAGREAVRRKEKEEEDEARSMEVS